ncbi:hypothetical protein QF012_003121 [Pseudomonas laurylsulfatiphila]|nr:hypothetical protein [Pseudomonas reinekei]
MRTSSLGMLEVTASYVPADDFCRSWLASEDGVPVDKDVA